MVATRHKYIDHSYAEAPLVAFRAGVIGEPEVIVTGGVFAAGTITFANNPTADDTITIDGVVFTFVAAGATGNEINISGVDLPGTLDNMLTILNGSAVAAVAAATYTEDGVDELTITHDSYDVSGNLFALASSDDTASGAFLTGGSTFRNPTVLDGPTNLALTSAVDQQMGLLDGDEAQRKFIYMSAISTGNAVVTPDNLSGGSTITFSGVGQYSELRFMNGVWVQTAGTATVA